MTMEGRLTYLKDKSEEYKNLRDSWKSEYKERKENHLSEHMKFVTSMVKKDVIRTDRSHKYYRGKEDNSHTTSLFDLLCTYALNHPSVSYCQGMCDLASPLLVVEDNEAHAYLLFCSLMQRLSHNFSFDGRAISTKFEHLTKLLEHFDPEFLCYLQENQVDDLLFAYRWLLLELKREFQFDDSLYFMEIMWSTIPFTEPIKPLVLYEATNREPSSNPMDYISPYTRLHNLENLTPESSRSSANFSDPGSPCEELVVDQSVLDAAEMIDFALDAGPEEFRERSSSVVSTSSSCCHCQPPNSGSVAGSAPSSKLLRDSCQCANSVDSGFVSRPTTPIKQCDEHLYEPLDLHHNFPAPHEFGFGNPFLMFATMAAIVQHRDTIMENKMDFNDIIMLFNDSARKNNVYEILYEARFMYDGYMNHSLEPDSGEFEHLVCPARQ